MRLSPIRIGFGLKRLIVLSLKNYILNETEIFRIHSEAIYNFGRFRSNLDAKWKKMPRHWNGDMIEITNFRQNANYQNVRHYKRCFFQA